MTIPTTTPHLKVLIVGAGIAGLCTAIALAKDGHDVIILERARALSPVGAGIHVPPNATLMLQNWGILEKFADKAVQPAGFVFRRYEDSTVLPGSQRKPAKNGPTTPYWSMRRADYQQILYEAAIEAGVEVRLGQQITSIDEATPSAIFADNTSLSADLVLAADGMKSTLRTWLLPNEDVSPALQPLSTYRAWAPISAMTSNPALAPLLDTPATNIWLGPDRHIITYPTHDETHGPILAINGTFPDPHTTTTSTGAAEWNKAASMEEIQTKFHDFDPTVRALLSHARDAKSWALAEVPALKTWLSPSGRVALVGDAAHGMLQFLAQGAAMATEDAGALAVCLRRVKSREDVPRAMAAYEKARKERCERVQAEARRNGRVIHLGDGVEQRARDGKMRGEVEVEGVEGHSGPLMDGAFTGWLYGYDTVKATEEVLDESGL